MIVKKHTFTEGWGIKVNEYDLILVDIDGVVMTPTQYLCSSQWYVRYIRETAAHKRETDFKLKVAEDLYYCLRNSEFVPVNADLIEFLSEQSQSNIVLGLTGRVASFHELTEYWLNQVSMTFSNINLQVPFAETDSIFHSGVIYVGHDPDTALPHDKGKVLSSFLKEYDKPIQRILFIDDFRTNLEHVEAFCNENNIDFHGIEFLQVEANYREQYTEEQLQMIGGIQFEKMFRNNELPVISDLEALGIAKDSQISGNLYVNITHNDEL